MVIALPYFNQIREGYNLLGSVLAILYDPNIIRGLIDFRRIYNEQT